MSLMKDTNLWCLSPSWKIIFQNLSCRIFHQRLCIWWKICVFDEIIMSLTHQITLNKVTYVRQLLLGFVLLFNISVNVVHTTNNRMESTQISHSIFQLSIFNDMYSVFILRKHNPLKLVSVKSRQFSHHWFLVFVLSE